MQSAARLPVNLCFAELMVRFPFWVHAVFWQEGQYGGKKSDVSVAKNYLNENEMKLLGLLVEQYLAFAETMAHQNIPMYMKDWIKRLDAIIQLNGRELLTHEGQISHAKAMEKSALEYEKYREDQKKIEHEQSLIELEKDIKSLIQKKPGKRDKKWDSLKKSWTGQMLDSLFKVR